MSLSVANPYLFYTSQGISWGNAAGSIWNNGRQSGASSEAESEASSTAGRQARSSAPSEIIDVEATLIDRAQDSDAQAAAERLVEINAAQSAYAYSPSRSGGVQFVYAALAPGQVLNRVA